MKKYIGKIILIGVVLIALYLYKVYDQGQRGVYEDIDVVESHDHSHDEGHSDILHSDYLSDYSIEDDEYGTIVSVAIEGDKRIITANGLPNHDTGDFPNEGNPNTISEQNVNYEYPLNPVWVGGETWVRDPGVAINGIKFEPETGESVACETGQSYRIEAKQDFLDLGLDFNNAHVQPTGSYHYHGLSGELVDKFDQGSDDLVHIGFAADGYLIYYSKDETYQTSYKLSEEERVGDSCAYIRTPDDEVQIDGTLPDGTFVSDWVYEEGLGDLDRCNGTTIDGQYVYLVSEDYPFVGRCLNGEVESRGQPGGAGGNGGQRQGPPQGQGGPGGVRPAGE